MLPRLVPLLLLAAIGLAGCVTPQSIEEPRVALQNVRLLKAEGLRQWLQVDLLVSNPNDFDIPVTGLDFVLQVNDTDFAHGLANDRVTIPRLGRATIPVEVSVSLVSVFQQLRTMSKTNTLDYGIAGKIYLDNMLLRTVPFDKAGSLALRTDSEGRILAPM